MSNIGSSGKQYAEDFSRMFTEPGEVAEGLGMIAKEAWQGWEPRYPSITGDRETQPTPALDAFKGFFGDRYGSMEKISNTAYTDPVGFMADLSTVMTGGAGLAARAPGVAGQVAKVAGKVAPNLDLLTGLAKGAGKVAEGAGVVGSELVGWATGAKGKAAREWGRSGREGGESSRIFRNEMRENVPRSVVVEEAKVALQNLYKKRSQDYNEQISAVFADTPKPTNKAGNVPPPSRAAQVSPDDELTSVTMAWKSPDELEAAALTAPQPPPAAAQGSVVPPKTAAARAPGVLDFAGIEKAFANVEGVQKFKGQDLSPTTAAVRAAMKERVDAWRALDPAEYHTAQGFDALKKSLGDLRDGTEHGTPSRKVADQVYHAVKAEIVSQAPGYAKVMENYWQASEQLSEVEKALSLGKKGNAETALRKLQSILRNDNSSAFGRRGELAEVLREAGAPHLQTRIAGQSASSWPPRGLSNATAPVTIMGGAGSLAWGQAHYLSLRCSARERWAKRSMPAGERTEGLKGRY